MFNVVLQERLLALHKNMPDVALRMEGHLPDASTQLLLDRALDIAVSYDSPSLPEIVLREIGELRLNLLATIRATPRRACRRLAKTA